MDGQLRIAINSSGHLWWPSAHLMKASIGTTFSWLAHAHCLNRFTVTLVEWKLVLLSDRVCRHTTWYVMRLISSMVQVQFNYGFSSVASIFSLGLSTLMSFLSYNSPIGALRTPLISNRWWIFAQSKHTRSPQTHLCLYKEHQKLTLM